MRREDPPLQQLLARGIEAAVASFLSPPRDRVRGGRKERRPTRPAKDGAGSGVISGTASSFLASLLMRWTKSHRPPMHRILRGAAAGVAAAGAVYAVRALAHRRDEQDDGKLRGARRGELTDELLAGAGRGVLYAALLAPHLPGPPVVRGALAGTVDYFAAPLGGFFSALQPLSPIRRVPVISILLETGDAEDDPYLTFLLHGALLGLLYGSPGSRD